MAEITTIARPYAEGLFKALQDRTAPFSEHRAVLSTLETVSTVIGRPEVSRLIGDPRLLPETLIGLVKDVGLGDKAPVEVVNLLTVVLENGRIEAWPEIVGRYRELINDAEGNAEVQIETAFEMSEGETADLIKALSKRFPGKKLIPTVTVNRDLIGGVRIRVGDQVLDDSISARLAEMKKALTA